jgi:hypothetical protein
MFGTPLPGCDGACAPGADARAVADWARGLPAAFASEAGDEVYRGRNLLRRLPGPDGAPLVVKRFRPLRGLAAWIARRRGSKAERSFAVALTVQERGLGTPAPCCWAAPAGEAGPSYYACAAADGYEQVRRLHDPSHLERDAWIARLGTYAGQLHHAGVLHRDFTVGNVLFDATRPAAPLLLVDLNRVRLGPVSLGDGVRNLVMLEQRDAMGTVLLTAYCHSRGADPARWRGVYARALAWHLGRFAVKNATRRWRRRLDPFRRHG